jgi:hypothetical protein
MVDLDHFTGFVDFVQDAVAVRPSSAVGLKTRMGRTLAVLALRRAGRLLPRVRRLRRDRRTGTLRPGRELEYPS